MQENLAGKFLWDNFLQEILAGKSCGKNLAGKFVWEILVEKFLWEILAGKFFQENLAGNSYGKFLQEILAGKSCGKIMWEICVGNSCGKFLWENLAGKSCRIFLWENLAENLVEKVLMVCLKNGKENTNIDNFWHLQEIFKHITAKLFLSCRGGSMLRFSGSYVKIG